MAYLQKGEDRRKRNFEEAAGIPLSYKKNRCERKLEKHGGKPLRLRDIIVMNSKSVESLLKTSEKHRIFKILERKADGLETSALAAYYDKESPGLKTWDEKSYALLTGYCWKHNDAEKCSSRSKRKKGRIYLKNRTAYLRKSGVK